MRHIIIPVLGLLLLYFFLMLLVGCGGPRLTYNKWDKNHNGKLDNYEFVSGYYNAKIFKKWSPHDFSIPAKRIAEDLFASMDDNNDNRIEESEFHTGTDYFYYGFMTPSFSDWDEDGNGYLEKKEFTSNGQKNIKKFWDFSGDGRINSGEMADGIFLTHDKNHNGTIDRYEFESWAEHKLR